MKGLLGFCQLLWPSVEENQLGPQDKIPSLKVNQIGPQDNLPSLEVNQIGPQDNLSAEENQIDPQDNPSEVTDTNLNNKYPGDDHRRLPEVPRRAKVHIPSKKTVADNIKCDLCDKIIKASFNLCIF